MASRNCWWELLASSLTITLALIHLVEANSEVDALSALRGSLSDPSNVLQSWDPSLVDPCTWFHITCNSDNSVTRVDLDRWNLSGHIAPEVGNLPNLQYLELYGNNIQGTIPSELGNLKNLISMDLYNNSLTDQIPTSFGNLKSLLFLRLNDNKLTGTVPKEVLALHLRVLDVSGNNIK